MESMFDDHQVDDLDKRKSDFLESSIDDEDIEDTVDLSDEPSEDAEEDRFDSGTLAYMGIEDPYQEGRYSY